MVDWAQGPARRRRAAGLGRRANDGCLRGRAAVRAVRAGSGRSAAGDRRAPDRRRRRDRLGDRRERPRRAGLGARPGAGLPGRAAASGPTPYKALLRSLERLAARRGRADPLVEPVERAEPPRVPRAAARRAASAAQPAISPGAYADLVRAAQAELPASARLVLGEVAGYDGPRAQAVGAAEFAAALPPDVVCAGEVWGQHAYVGRGSTTLAADREAGGHAQLLARRQGGARRARLPAPAPHLDHRDRRDRHRRVQRDGRRAARLGGRPARRRRGPVHVPRGPRVPRRPRRPRAEPRAAGVRGVAGLGRGPRPGRPAAEPVRRVQLALQPGRHRS